MEDQGMSLGIVLTAFVLFVLVVSVAAKEWERHLKRQLKFEEMNGHQSKLGHQRKRK